MEKKYTDGVRKKIEKVKCCSRLCVDYMEKTGGFIGFIQDATLLNKI